MHFSLSFQKLLPFIEKVGSLYVLFGFNCVLNFKNLEIYLKNHLHCIQLDERFHDGKSSINTY